MSIFRFCSLTSCSFLKTGLFSESIITVCSRTSAGHTGGEEKKTPPRRPRTPQGRFDTEEEDNKTTDPFKKFPDNVNPYTKEKGGPTGPEPTRYGDWERKGRCIDF